MLWTPIAEIPEHLQPARWRCPECGERCARVGTPQVIVQSPTVQGGEYVTFECVRGHRVQPSAKHYVKA